MVVVVLEVFVAEILFLFSRVVCHVVHVGCGAHAADLACLGAYLQEAQTGIAANAAP